MNDIAPEHYAESYDNVGLLAGCRDTAVTGIVVALDVNSDTVDFAADNGCNMIITHHPIIFTPIKRVVTDDPVGNILYKLISNGMALYSAHTNFDKADGGTDDVLAGAIGIIEPKRLCDEFCDGKNIGLGRYGSISPVTAGELKAKLIKEIGSNIVTTAPSNKLICRVASCAGSGSDGVEFALAQNADIFITGEMNYHSALDAKRSGLDVMLCSHADSEEISMNFLKNTLQNRLNGVQYNVNVISAPKGRLWQ